MSLQPVWMGFAKCGFIFFAPSAVCLVSVVFVDWLLLQPKQSSKWLRRGWWQGYSCRL